MHTSRMHTSTFVLNESGRDFVVGDVHGCFRTLEHALGALTFDPNLDRLFGVGDLVNRGPHSAEGWGGSSSVSMPSCWATTTAPC